MSRTYKGMFVSSAANSIQREKMLENKSRKVRATNKEKSEKDIMMAKGLEFVENGIPFDMAPEELQKHYFFKIGYEIGVRRKKINDTQSVGKVRK